MVHYKLPAHGIDSPIQAIQHELHDGLICMWGLSEADYQCYGRCQKVPQGTGYKPAVYKGGLDYTPVTFDDSFAVQSFFGISDRVDIEGGDSITDVHIVFFMHLGKITLKDWQDKTIVPANRVDMEARNSVQAIIGQNNHGFTLESIVTGPEAIREYQLIATGKQANAVTRYDMHPFHFFRINGTLRWPSPQFYNNNFNN